MASNGSQAEDFLKGPLYIYDLPSKLLSNLTPKSYAQVIAPSTIDVVTPIATESPERDINTIPTSNSCTLCQISFPSVQERRDHARSDHHRYNVKAQLRGNRVLTESEFTKAIGDIDESISGSESSESDEDEFEPHPSDSNLVALLKKQARISQEAEREAPREKSAFSRQPMIWFSSPDLPPNTAVGVYKALFSNEEQDEPEHIVDSLRRKQLEPIRRVNNAENVAATHNGPHIFMCMIGGGHFAAMVIALAPEIQKRHGGIEERQARVLAHKTFHRYTTRRKQGGSQSANDSAKGAAHSAGSSLRRYNEAALENDIRTLLKEWRSMIDTAQLIFVRATGNTNRRTLFGSYEGQVLRNNDIRLRNFPFSTRRATQAELMRCFKELTKAKVSQIDEAALAAAQNKQREASAKASKPSAQPKTPKLSEEEEAAMLHTSQIQALIRRSKAPALLSYISNNAVPPSFKFFPTDAPQNYHAPTPLHLAANSDSPALVTSLLTKAKFDPTVKNGEGKTPFDLAGDRATRDAFRVARHEMGESAWDWEAAHVPSPVSRAEVSQRQEQQKEEAAKEEASRRKAEIERLKAEETASAAALDKRKNAGGKKLSSVDKTAAEKREDEMRGMTPEMRMRLERERRARAAEERIRRMQRVPQSPLFSSVCNFCNLSHSGEMDILQCVGKLCRWDPITKQVSEPRPISAYRPFLVGRDRKTCHYVLDDACVSSLHLRIYTVVYDFDNPLEVAPLVYAQDMSTNGAFWNGQRIDRRNGGAVLLSDGDILRLSSNSFLEFRSEYQSEKPLTSVQKEEAKVVLSQCLSYYTNDRQDFADEYLITDRILGEGSFGRVHMAVSLNSTSQVACKVVTLRAVKTTRKSADTNMFELQKREMFILQKLCHPNIIGVEKVILTENSLFIFEELITAGDLFTFIASKGDNITDFDAACIIRQILIALNYLHDKNIAHRDLKPENILMTSHGVHCRVVLADFGCAQIMSSGMERMSTVVGTWDYTAPEVYKEMNLRGYTKSVDLWSVGCITVVLLIGTPPFPFSASGTPDDGEPGDLKEVFMNIRWDEASTWAQSFVLSLLVLDERKRLTVREALQHSWFTNAQYKSKLKQNYERAVRDWRPRVTRPLHKDENFLQADARLVDSTKGVEQTLSKLKLPGSRVYKTTCEKDTGDRDNSKFFDAKILSHEQAVMGDFGVIDAPGSHSTRRSFSPRAWSTQFTERQHLFSSNILNVNQKPRAWPPENAWEQAQRPWLSTSKNVNGDGNIPTDITLLISNPVVGIKRPLDETVSQPQEEGEVYEEIENKITGKKQRVLYRER
ncbi:hypothetical protein UA08_00264 [Talaromyces atroroseus]|uniref:VMS1-like protein n=1 Tax=Talaromyces atroroseus TaxID=1441469 RepID=A0A225B1Q7_TALAT|nr:hypothetical protein UA08_00264 [Talaromyces atroroseus]OKL63638.1 hypothetical protein UA08_00264 [Talaromyces atroroseus]